MRVRLIAVGTRMPAWVSAGCDEYLRRLRPALRVDIVELAPGPRSAGTPVGRAMEDEARRQLGRLAKDEYVVALDERGKAFSSVELSRWLAERMRDGRDLAFLIGGPDGFAPAVRERADLDWSLSRLTLPHALVRVVLAEQLYRAHSLLAGHPYHRA
ncbi:MAG: 23S rRNA (pseudouridine(1915)-N(3))-methyltransferase RlmH [Steroidobacteraceae bacterium]|nr:23S rRNA (pseudouridine(1915)-N(3))-methyltransferase RlmH [Steroidobacteraceae bacterium]